MCQATKRPSCTDGLPDLWGHKPQIFLGFFVFYTAVGHKSGNFLTLIKWPCTMANVYSLHLYPT